MTHAVNSYAQYLKVRYQEPLPDDERLLENIGKSFIELAVIRSENISRECSVRLGYPESAIITQQ